MCKKFTVLVALMCLASVGQAAVLNVDIGGRSEGEPHDGNSRTGTPFTGQGVFEDPGNDYWTQIYRRKTAENLLESDGVTETGITVAVSGGDGYEDDAKTNYLLSDYTYNQTTATITGLKPDGIFDVYVYAAGDQAGQGSDIIIGDQTLTTTNASNFDYYVEGENYVVFYDATADANGIMIIATGGGNKLNGFQLVGEFPIQPKVLEDFEGDLSAWNMDEDDPNVLGIAVDPLDPNNQALMVLPAVNGGITLPWAVEPNDSATLSFRMMYDGVPGVTVNGCGVGAADEGGAHWNNMFSIARLSFAGPLDYYDGDGYVTAIEAPEPLKWYTMIMDLDTASGTYDLYIDGARVAQDARFRSQDPNGIASVLIRHANKMLGSAIYVDDIVTNVPIPEVVWDLDMSTDPVPDPMQVRDGKGGNYVMNGEGQMQVTGECYLDPLVRDYDIAYDLTVHFVVKSESAEPIRIWSPIDSSLDDNYCLVGPYVHLNADGTQHVEISDGGYFWVTPYEPLIITGFAADAYVDIILECDYETDSLVYTVTDGIKTETGTHLYHSTGAGGNGSGWTLFMNDGASGLIDQLSIIVHGTGVHSD